VLAAASDAERQSWVRCVEAAVEGARMSWDERQGNSSPAQKGFLDGGWRSAAGWLAATRSLCMYSYATYGKELRWIGLLMLFALMLRHLSTLISLLLSALFFLPFWCLLSLVTPSFNGWLLTRSLDHLFFHGGFHLDFGAIHISPYVNIDLSLPFYEQRLNLAIRAVPTSRGANTAKVPGVGFGNPPGGAYPHKYFLNCTNFSTIISVSFGTMRNLVKILPFSPWYSTRWSPFPSVCKKQTARNPVERVGVVEIDHIEFSQVSVNFEMADGEFNINGFTRVLAEKEAFTSLDLKGEQRPNKLTVTVMEGRALRAKDQDWMGKSVSADPFVKVTLRGEAHKTETVRKDLNPKWSEHPSGSSTFEMPVVDPSAVLVIEANTESPGIVTGSRCIGRWIITLKWLLMNPRFCHFSTMEVSPDGTVEGWFPLSDSKGGRVGECGELRLRIRWHHDPNVAVIKKKLTALQQLKLNSAESQLRLGKPADVFRMLEQFPLLLAVKRVTIRDADFYGLNELFKGYEGAADAAARKQKAAEEKREAKRVTEEKKQTTQEIFGDIFDGEEGEGEFGTDAERDTFAAVSGGRGGSGLGSMGVDLLSSMGSSSTELFSSSTDLGGGGGGGGGGVGGGGGTNPAAGGGNSSGGVPSRARSNSTASKKGIMKISLPRVEVIRALRPGPRDPAWQFGLSPSDDSTGKKLSGNHTRGLTLAKFLWAFWLHGVAPEVANHGSLYVKGTVHLYTVLYALY
jgi:hypothetical protein